MRRQDIQLISRARRGDAAACFEAGRLYLEGMKGFPRHVPLGLEYLSQVETLREDEAQRLIVEALDLHEIAVHGRVSTLERAARLGSGVAQLRVAIWNLLTQVDQSEAVGWLRLAERSGQDGAKEALTLPASAVDSDDAAVLRVKALLGVPKIGWPELIALAMERALMRREPRLLLRALAVSLVLGQLSNSTLADQVYAAISFAKSIPDVRITVDTKAIEVLLDDCVDRGNCAAALLLGQALSGNNVGSIGWDMLVQAPNRRKASALLMRAADAGYGEAWTRLYELHANNHSSVANPPMARFFLEKAAASGDVSAQRRLGATILRAAASLRDAEQGMHWLYLASQSQDFQAQALIRTFILPVQGCEADAARGIFEVAKTNGALAARLRVARDFGLTKLEAMTVDIVEGLRPWGLVVGKNPFIQHARLSSPRAIPALSSSTLQTLKRSAGYLADGGVQGSGPRDVELRHRAARLKQALDNHGLSESLYFAKASSDALDAMRGGPRWARQVKLQLDAAMGHEEEELG